MHKKIYEYVNADIIDTKQNIHLSSIDNDLYYVSCRHLNGKYYITFQSKESARANYNKLRKVPHVKVLSGNGRTVNIDVLSPEEFKIACTYSDFKQVISSLRKQHVNNKCEEIKMRGLNR